LLLFFSWKMVQKTQPCCLVAAAAAAAAAARCVAAGFKHLADGCTFAAIACLLGLQAVCWCIHLTLLTAMYK